MTEPAQLTQISDNYNEGYIAGRALPRRLIRADVPVLLAAHTAVVDRLQVGSEQLSVPAVRAPAKQCAANSNSELRPGTASASRITGVRYTEFRGL